MTSAVVADGSTLSFTGPLTRAVSDEGAGATSRSGSRSLSAIERESMRL
jgi:hypothetical protein